MSQLTVELRPKTWDSVIGQDDNIELLKSIIKNRDEAPKIIIFEGAMGTGKTSCARIFARELNRLTEQVFDEKAKEVDNDIYIECDSSRLPVNEESISDLLTNKLKKHWKVVLLDEVQALTPTQQTKLLIPFEQLGKMVFIILATTNITAIQKPLRSRALELNFAPVPYEAILTHLTDVERVKGKPISTEAKQYLAYRAHGHMRNLHMLVDKYYLMGDEAFMRNIHTTMDCLCDFFMSALENRQDVIKYLNILVNRPLAELREDFDEFIIKCAQETIGISSNNTNIKRVADAYGSNFKIVVDTYFHKWIGSMFDSDTLFHLSMMNFYKAVKDWIK